MIRAELDAARKEAADKAVEAGQLNRLPRLLTSQSSSGRGREADPELVTPSVWRYGRERRPQAVEPYTGE